MTIPIKSSSRSNQQSQMASKESLLIQSKDQVRHLIHTVFPSPQICSHRHPSIKKTKQKKGLSNLMEIYAGLSGNSIEMIESQFSTSQKQDFKASLAELCIEKLSPIRENIIRLRNEKSFVEKIIHQGNQSAQQKASETILQVRQTCGLQAF
eukprot:Sdes_comp20718_c0_seq2m16435